MKIQELLNMDMGEAVEWLEANQHDYRLMKVTEIDCDHCGMTFDTTKPVYDSDSFKCPECGYMVCATVDEDGSLTWYTFTSEGEAI